MCSCTLDGAKGHSGQRCTLRSTVFAHHSTSCRSYVSKQSPTLLPPPSPSPHIHLQNQGQDLRIRRRPGDILTIPPAARRRLRANLEVCRCLCSGLGFRFGVFKDLEGCDGTGSKRYQPNCINSDLFILVLYTPSQISTKPLSRMWQPRQCGFPSCYERSKYWPAPSSIRPCRGVRLLWKVLSI